MTMAGSVVSRLIMRRLAQGQVNIQAKFMPRPSHRFRSSKSSIDPPPPKGGSQGQSIHQLLKPQPSSSSPVSFFAYHMFNTPKEFQRPKLNRLLRKGEGNGIPDSLTNNSNSKLSKMTNKLLTKLRPLVVCNSKINYSLVLAIGGIVGMTTYSIITIIKECI